LGILTRYVDPENQLIVELYVSSLKDSIEFYKKLGFEVLREDDEFVELKWEDSRLFLEKAIELPARPSDLLAGNIRIMVPNVDDYWLLAQKLGAKVVKAIGNRDYGLRDFTIAGPDGLGLRFATRI
jgi:catechol 2,3-dioxygenase-like lactoylglutathione lyase family enzyme